MTMPTTLDGAEGSELWICPDANSPWDRKASGYGATGECRVEDGEKSIGHSALFFYVFAAVFSQSLNRDECFCPWPKFPGPGILDEGFGGKVCHENGKDRSNRHGSGRIIYFRAAYALSLCRIESGLRQSRGRRTEIRSGHLLFAAAHVLEFEAGAAFRHDWQT